MRVWTPSVGAMGHSAELTRLGTKGHGAEFQGPCGVANLHGAGMAEAWHHATNPWGPKMQIRHPGV